MKYLFIAFILIIATSSTIAQTYNQTDKQGKKFGKWEKKYDNGNIKYTGQFENGYEVGDFIYYYPNNKVKTKMHFTLNGVYASVKMYAKNGNIQAEGSYYNKQKHSKWIFYSETTGAISKKESYLKGVKDGDWIVYYPNGKVSSKMTWINGKREGVWNEYFENGEFKLTSTFKNDKINGDYITFYTNGQVSRKGKYVDGKANGNWIIYNEEGIYTAAEVWNMGFLTLERKYKNGKMVYEMDHVNNKETDLRKQKDGEEK